MSTPPDPEFDPTKWSDTDRDEPDAPLDLGPIKADPSLRDYFATALIGPLYIDYMMTIRSGGTWQEDWRFGLAQDAYLMADAMLAAREESKS